MVKPILVANWKNYPNSLAEARSLLKEIARRRALFLKTVFFIAPPAPYFDLVSQSPAKLAAQDLPQAEKGARTGALSLEMLKSFGVKLAILGHSERRALGESSAEVAKKVGAALRSGIIPLVCVGEEARDKDGEHFELLREEMKASLAGVTKAEAEKVLIAYEPVWAIGKSAKDAIEPAELAQTVLFIKKVFSDLFGRKAAEKLGILYGGSVEPRNARALLESGVRGFLVGHASLNARSFSGVVEALFDS